MKRKLLVLLAILAVTCWVSVVLADTTGPIDLNIINTANPPVVAGTPPYAQVTIDLNTTTHVATFTFTASDSLIIFDQGAVDMNLAFTPAIANITLTSPGAVPNHPDPGVTLNANVSTFGRFTVTYDRFDGTHDGAGTFIITISGVPVSFTHAADLLAANAGGSTLAAHLFFPTAPANANTFYVSNGNQVPIPPTALLLGTGLLGIVAMGRRRKKRETGITGGTNL